MRLNRAVPAIVLGLSGTGLSVVRQLARRGISVTGLTWQENEAGSYTRYGSVLRAPNPASDPSGLMELLNSVAAGKSGRIVIVPSADEAVTFLQEHSEALSPQYSFYRLPSECAEALVDKWRQFQLAKAAGVTLPQTFYPRSVAHVDEFAGELHYPAFIKPCFGHLWRKHFQSKGIEAANPAELRRHVGKVLDLGLEIVVQSVIQGPASNLISVCCHIGPDGMPAGIFTQRKVRQYPLDFGVGTLVESISYPELETEVVRFLQHVGYRGTGEVEYKIDDRDGVARYIELNPRVWQQHSLAVACGVDFALLQYLDLAGEPVPEMRQLKTGLRWIALFEDCLVYISLMRRGELSFSAWLRSMLAVRAHNAFSWSDPVPVLRLWAGYSVGVARSLLRKVLRRR